MSPGARTAKLPSTAAGRQLRRRLAGLAAVGLIGPLLVFLGVLAARQLEAQRSLIQVQAADAAEARAGRLLPAVSAAATQALEELGVADVQSAARVLVSSDGELLAPRLPASEAEREPLPLRVREAIAAGRELEFRIFDAPAALHHYRRLVANTLLQHRPAVLGELLGSYARTEDWVAAEAVARELLHGYDRGWWSLDRTEYLHAQLMRLEAARRLGQDAPDLSSVLCELEVTAAVEGPGLRGGGFYRAQLRAAGATLDPAWEALLSALVQRGEPLPSGGDPLTWIPELGVCLAATPTENGDGHWVGRLDMAELLSRGLAPAARDGQQVVVRDPQGRAVWWSTHAPAPSPTHTAHPDPAGPTRILVWRDTPLRGWSLELSAADDASAERGYRRQRLVLLALVGVAALVLVLATWILLGQAAKAVDLARARTDFVAGVTHDLKTPLALIRLYGETLQLHPDQDAEKRAAFAGIVVREADRLHDLVENVLQLTRGEDATPKLSGSDLSRTVSAAVEEIALPPTPSYEVVTRIDPELPPVTHAPSAVRQILRNLLANAMKFSPEGGRIEVALEVDGDQALLAVSDEGVGIAPGDRERVFEAFVRLDAKGAPTPGSGLGLAIVRRLARLHGGSAQAVARERGTRIEVRLPLAA